MPYDLYGTYYASRRDAENAEMAQCAAIDMEITKREMEQQMASQQQQEQSLWQYIYMLEERIANLESRLTPSMNK